MKHMMLALIAALSLFGSTPAQAEALPSQPPIPKDNPMTPAKIELGK